MKKIIILAVTLLMFTTLTIAQAVKKVEVKKTETKTKVAPPSKTVTTSTVVLKKDGTPDKRYSNVSKTTGPLKKDGTLDKRFKKNKTN